MPSHKTLTSGSNRKSGQSPDPASCHGVLLGWLRKLRSKSLKVLCNGIIAEVIFVLDFTWQPDIPGMWTSLVICSQARYSNRPPHGSHGGPVRTPRGVFVMDR